MQNTSISPVAIKLDQATKDRVKHLADAKDRSAHWLMKEAISQYLDREEEREQLKKQSLESWQSYQETGLHVTGAEVKDWLATWGEAEQKSKLECHK